MSRVIRKIENVPGLTAQEKERLKPVAEQFEFRVSTYYANLINWSDPNDPLRRIVLPGENELDSNLEFDPSDEAANTIVHGLQHKYRTTALLLVNDVCAAYCRFCFRKRFTLSTSLDNHIIPANQIDREEKETTFNVEEGIRYIAQHPEINNVLLTGGDPLMLSPSRLEPIIQALHEIPHIKITRIGTKVPAFNPELITSAVLDMLAQYSQEQHRIYLMMHFNHQREITALVEQKIDQALRRGLIMCNQTPLLKGINDDALELTALLNRLVENGVIPHYIFHCRPTRGNESFMLSIQEGMRIVADTRANLSGLAKRFRYVGSHTSGKIELVGQIDDQIIMRYHEARHPEDEEALFSWPAHVPICWFDEPVAEWQSKKSMTKESQKDAL
jgi:KamA family protein